MTRGPYRHTKIIATLGPATESPEKIRALIESGIDVIRLNMAHATGEWVATLILRIREISKSVGRHVAVMMDVKGPEIRTGVVATPIDLQVGDIFEFHTQKPPEGCHGVEVNYAGFPDDVKMGATVLVDSGLIRMVVVEKDSARVCCRVETPARLGSRRHINLPGVEVRLPALTLKDENDLRVGVAAGIDFVALSFVRKGEDVQTLKAFLLSLGSNARIIAKIEDQAGVRNMTEIVREADAIMVARGDLGIEIDYYRLPLVQTQLVQACLAAGKPVIIATQLLESMITAPMPTRAEISDVSNAVRERADCVMLSGETATGLYPLDCVAVLKNILGSIEPSEERQLNRKLRLEEPKAKMLRSAAELAQQLGQSAIVVFTRSGFLAYTLASLRADGVPIYAFTDDEALFRQLLLPWGVEPFLIEFNNDPEETILNALSCLKRKEWAQVGDWMVVITNVLAHGKIVDTLQIRKIE